MSLFGLFAYEESATGYAVVQWQCLHGYVVVFVNDAVFLGVDAVQDNFVVHSLAEVVELWLKNGLQHRVCVYVQRVLAPEQPECGNHSH